MQNYSANFLFDQVLMILRILARSSSFVLIKICTYGTQKTLDSKQLLRGNNDLIDNDLITLYSFYHRYSDLYFRDMENKLEIFLFITRKLCVC